MMLLLLAWIGITIDNVWGLARNIGFHISIINVGIGWHHGTFVEIEDQIQRLRAFQLISRSECPFLRHKW